MEDTEKGALEGSDWMAHLPELTSGQQHSAQTFPNLGATIKKLVLLSANTFCYRCRKVLDT